MTEKGQRKRFRSATVTLGGAALIAVGLTSCSSGTEYAQACVDENTKVRVEEDKCDRGYGGVGPRYSWFYVPNTAGALPGVGQSMSGLQGGSFSAPSTGSSISRGGFGGKTGGGSFGG